MVHHKFLPQDRTVNREYHLEVMRRLRETIRQKRTEKKNQSGILHHDNAQAYTLTLVRQFFLAKTYIIGHYKPSVRIIDLVSHSTYVVCVHFYT